MHLFITKHENYFTFRIGDISGSEPFKSHIEFTGRVEYVKKHFGATSTEIVEEEKPHPCTWCIHMRPCIVGGMKCVGGYSSKEAEEKGSCEGVEN